MSHRYEFVANVTEGAIVLPDEIVSRLRSKGISRLRVVATSVADDEAKLAQRGIDSDAIERVAEVQRFDRDVATMVLSGEGAATDAALLNRLLLLNADSESTQS